MLSPGEVLILSGPPGSGKSTVGAELASRSTLGVHLESDIFYHWIRSGFVGPHLPEAHHQNTVVIDAVAEAAAAYARGGYAVVWDGVVGPWFLERVVRRLSDHGLAVHYAVLRPDRETALGRVARRDQTADVSGAETMWAKFADLAELETHVVASDGAPDEVVAEVESSVVAGLLKLPAATWVNDHWPVSVKGVVSWNRQVVLLRNERDEWELPGGRLELTDTSPEAALRREFAEELALDVTVGELIDSWIYDVAGKRVLILVYRCTADEPPNLSHSNEHSGVAKIHVDTLTDENIPAGYVRSISSAIDGETDDIADVI